MHDLFAVLAGCGGIPVKECRFRMRYSRKHDMITQKPEYRDSFIMRRVDFSNGKTFQNILQTSLPLFIAQILALLYNIVDRIYIARIPEVGTAALGAVGLCFPLIVIITAFTNLYGIGSIPLFSIERGKKDEKRAALYMDLAFFLLVGTAVILTAAGELSARPVLTLFGASENALLYAVPYLRIYLLGTVVSMIATGMNPFITAQGYSVIGMITVLIGAGANILLDPLFIFTLGLGVRGAAAATVISQSLSALFVLRFLFSGRADPKLRLLRREEILSSGKMIKNIIGLGIASFIMQFTNSIVQICANSVLVRTGGDLYVSVMTIISSARQIFELPLFAVADGTAPIISYNYGARRPDKVKEAGVILFFTGLLYSLVLWLFMRAKPEVFISVFTSDKTILADAVPAFHLYFFAFVFMTFQHTGQTMFKSLNKRGQATFFSLFRKVIIVVPLTFLLPYVFGKGTDGVFMAEPVSNIIGGLACFITMLLTVGPELRRMKAG